MNPGSLFRDISFLSTHTVQKKGKYHRRKTVINKTLIQKVKYLKESKNLSLTDISKLTGVSCHTIYKILKKHLGYISNRLAKSEETN